MAEAPRNSGDRRNGSPFLSLDRVHKSFGGVAAVRDISFDIDEGSFVAIMGPSGCGKTTTLRLLAGLEVPTSGEIYFRGEAISERKPWQRDMPLVWQNLALFPFLDVESNVAFGLKMAGVDRRERLDRARRWLDRLGIGDLAKRGISVLSGGQLQRVALARALITEPEILLLDEPLSALDAHLVVRMQEELTRLQRDLGITFVYVTHNQSEAFAMADRVVIMNEGSVQQIGTPREVYSRPCNRFVAEFVGTNNLLTGSVEKIAGGCLRVRTSGGTFEVNASDDEAVAEGDPVHVVVSADRVLVARDHDSTRANSIRGRLVSEQFIGTVVTVYLDADELGDLRVQLQQREWDRLGAKAGEELVASWSPEDCLVVGA